VIDYGGLDGVGVVKSCKYKCRRVASLMETILFENNDSVKKTYEIENLHWGWELIYNQTLVEKHNFNKIEKNEKLEILHYFANNLQKMTDFGLIHGDIKRSNVVFDGIKLNLIGSLFKLYFEALIKIVLKRMLIKK